MKKSIVTFFVLVVTLVSFAQNDTEHLTFKGVPIDGTLSEYVKKMKSAGFEYLEGGIDYAVLQGDFAGFKDCNVLIYTLDAINVVSKICVLFPECNVWSSLEQNYNLLKSMLSQKYGVPTEVVEQFQNSPVPKTNNDKLFELSMDRCTWYTLYETPKGDIKLSLQKGDYGKYFVSLMYYDKINTDAVRSSAIDDL